MRRSIAIFSARPSWRDLRGTCRLRGCSARRPGDLNKFIRLRRKIFCAAPLRLRENDLNLLSLFPRARQRSD
jgi:hypothetical protein